MEEMNYGEAFYVFPTMYKKDLFAVKGHMLVAGATGSGKSVFLHRVIWGAVRCGHQVIIIDPKKVEYQMWNSPYVLNCPVVTDSDLAAGHLRTARDLMMSRYEDMAKRKVRQWDKSIEILVIDEVAELTQTFDTAYNREMIALLSDIARLGRAAGIHLVVATQYPTAKVLPMQLLMNIDYRVCLRVPNQIASRVVLGHAGAERLNGSGDAIIQIPGREWRTQLHYTTDEEIKETIELYEKTGRYRSTAPRRGRSRWKR